MLKVRLSLVVMLYHHFKHSRDIQTTGDDGFLHAAQHNFSLTTSVLLLRAHLTILQEHRYYNDIMLFHHISLELLFEFPPHRPIL